MIAYQFDPAGLLVGTTEADPSPLEDGVFLVPARCTLEPPPSDVPAGEWPRWNGTAWALVSRPPAVAAQNENPLAKLQAFLTANPDVAELINLGGV